MKHILPLPAAFLLTACAVAFPVGPPNPQGSGISDENTGTIVVYRNAVAGFIGNVASTPAITVDGNSAGVCLTNQPAVVTVAPGTHTVTLTENGQASQEVSVETDETIYLRCDTEANPRLSPAPTLEPVDAATGARESGV